MKRFIEKQLLTERAILDLKDIEREVNRLLSIHLGQDVDMRSDKYPQTKILARALFCDFVKNNMHRYNAPEQKDAISVFLEMSRNEVLESMQSAKEYESIYVEYRRMKKTLGLMGIKMTTEGWVSSKAVRIKFINAQIETLLKRKQSLLAEEI